MECPLRNTWSRSRDRPPPEEYTPRKVGVRGILVVEDLTQGDVVKDLTERGRPPPEEYPQGRSESVENCGGRPGTNRKKSPPEE